MAAENAARAIRERARDVASMRPRRMAAENDLSGPTAPFNRLASMRPRRMAAENLDLLKGAVCKDLLQ